MKRHGISACFIEDSGKELLTLNWVYIMQNYCNRENVTCKWEVRNSWAEGGKVPFVDKEVFCHIWKLLGFLKIIL